MPREKKVSTAEDAAPDAAPVQKQPPATNAKDKPKRIRLTSPYGFYDDDGAFHNWMAGHETADSDEIATLVGRGAEHEVLEK